MNCREVADFLMDYVSGELPSRDRGIFETHLAACPECVEYLRSYERTIALTRESAKGPCEMSPPPERLVQAILAICPNRPARGSCDEAGGTVGNA